MLFDKQQLFNYPETLLWQVRMSLRIYFGEILGKHSDVRGTLDQEDLEILSEDQDFINKLLEPELFPTGRLSGYNPVRQYEDYIRWDMEEEYATPEELIFYDKYCKDTQ